MAGKVFKWSKKEEKYTMFVDDDCEEQEYTDASNPERLASDNDNMEDLEDIANGHMEERRDDDSDILSGESDENSESRNSNYESMQNKKRRYAKGLIIKRKKNW